MHGVRPVSRRLKNKTMHTTFELWQATIEDPMLAPIMQGVYPTDKLPIVNKYPSGLIANTDPHDKPGTYWVATYFILLWESGVFFDSYRCSTDTYGIDGYINQNVTRYNDKPFQGLTSDTWRLLLVSFTSSSR